MKGDYRYTFYALSYLKKYWFRLLFILLMSVLVIVLSLIPIEIFRRLIDVVIPAKDLQTVLLMVGAVLGVHLVLLAVGYIQDLMLTKLNIEITRKIQEDFFNQLLRLPPAYSSRFKSGELMEKMIDDTEEIVDSTFDLILSPVLDIISLVIAITYMFLISPRLTLVALIFIPVLVLMIVPINRITRRKYSAIKRGYAAIYELIEEKLAGIRKIIASKKRSYEKKSLARHLREYDAEVYNYEKFSSKLESAISMVSDISPYAVLLYAAYEIIQGRLQVGTLLAFTMLMPRLFGPVKELVGKEFEFQTLEVTAKRVFTILHDTEAASQREKGFKKRRQSFEER